MNRYEISDRTVGHVPQGHTTPLTLVTDATLAYADTSEHLFTLATSNPVLVYNKDYHLQIKVTYSGNPSNTPTLTIGALSLGESNATPLTAATLVESGAWDEKAIALNASGGTNTETYHLMDITKRGNYLYLKYDLSADPVNDIKVEIKLLGV